MKDISRSNAAVRSKAVQGVLRHIRAKQLGLIPERETLYNGDLILPIKRREPHPLDSLYDPEKP